MSAPLTDREQRMRHALQMAVGALQAVMAAAKASEEATIRFTGAWEALGAVTLGAVLNETNEVLGEVADAAPSLEP